MQNQVDTAALIAQHAEAAADMNRERHDYRTIAGDGSHFLIANHGGIYLSNDSIYPATIARIADSWIDELPPRVNLEKHAPDELPPPPAVVNVPLDVLNVPRESNAVVMARAVSLVRSRRLAAERASADEENRRALDAEEARAAAARKLAGE